MLNVDQNRYGQKNTQQRDSRGPGGVNELALAAADLTVCHDVRRNVLAKGKTINPHEVSNQPIFQNEFVAYRRAALRPDSCSVLAISGVFPAEPYGDAFKQQLCG